MILMGEKGIRSEIYYSVYQYGKATNKHLKDYDRNKDYHIFNIGMQIIYMDEQCHKSCL